MQLPQYKVLVCGGKDYAKTWDTHLSKVVIDSYAVHLLHSVLLNLVQEHPDTALICSSSRGADSIARTWAEEHNVSVILYEADLDISLQERTNKVLTDNNPALVIAFPGGRCTTSILDRAKQLGIPIKVIEYEE